MIRIQDQKTEQKKNKYVNQNRQIQKAKKIGGWCMGTGAVVLAGAAKYGKQIVEFSKPLASTAIKTISKIRL